MSTDYPCTRCGACCRAAHLIPDFPEKLNDDGSCSRLVNNECSIYDDRPLICNLREMEQLTRIPDFYQKQAEFCNLLMDMEGLPEEMRVKL